MTVAHGGGQLSGDGVLHFVGEHREVGDQSRIEAGAVAGRPQTGRIAFRVRIPAGAPDDESAVRVLLGDVGDYRVEAPGRAPGRRGKKVAVRLAQLRALAPTHAAEDVEAVVVDTAVAAGKGAEDHFAALESRLRCLQVVFDALKLPAGAEIDDPRDGVGTVNGRGAVGQDVHGLDQRRGDAVEVHGLASPRFLGEPLAVEQDQRALAAQGPQAVEIEEALVAHRSRVGSELRRLDRRHRIQHLVGAGGRANHDIVLGQGRDHLRALLRPPDDRTGDQHLL